MSDKQDPIAALWRQYDEIASTNPVVAARFARDTRLFETPRPTSLADLNEGQRKAVIALAGSDTGAQQEVIRTFSPTWDIPKAPDPRNHTARLAEMHADRTPTPEERSQQAINALAWTRKISQ